MITPEVREALRRWWRDELAAEIARRTSSRTDSADHTRQRLLDELEAMSERLFPVSLPESAGLPSIEVIAEGRIQAGGDWSRIDEIRRREDLAPANAIAIVLAKDAKLAMRMFTRWVRGRG